MMRHRVLQVIADGAPGGGTTHVLQLLRGLGTEFEMAVVTEVDSYLSREAVSKGVPVYGGSFFRSRIDPRVPKALHRIVRDFRPELIHAHGGRAGFFTSFVKAEAPVVYTVHGLHVVHKLGVFNYLGRVGERRAMGRADHVIFVADYDRRMAERLGLRPSRTPWSLIYNGVSVEEIPPASAPRWDVGFVGRLERQKDPLLFVEVMRRLQGLRAVMVGGGTLEARTRRLIARRGLSDSIDMLGPLPRQETIEVLRQVRVLLMTSRWEGLPILLLEAMACGVPVVAPRVGGVPEVLSDGAGVLVPQRDPGALASAVIDLLREEPRRVSTVERARRRVRETFGEKQMLERVCRLYRSMLRRSF